MSQLKPLGLLTLMMGMFGEKINRDFALAQNMPHSSTFHHYSHPNQRKQRKEKRRTVFANRRIARGF